MKKSKKAKQIETENERAKKAGQIFFNAAVKMMEHGVPASAVSSAMLGVGIDLAMRIDNDHKITADYLRSVADNLIYHDPKNSKGKLDA